MERRRILVVDDEAGLRKMVASYLASDGFEVAEAAGSTEALRLFREKAPDLVLLDVVMPGSDGFEVLREIRAESDVPVIMLTARVEEVDRVVGLTVGADDYVTKPFSPRELTARIRAVLRRWKASPSLDDDVLRFEGLTVDAGRREVVCDGEHVDLSALEFDLLAAMSSAPGRVFTREQLLERVWGWDYFGAERVVDVHISSLRRKLGDQATDPRFIATVRGVGRTPRDDSESSVAGSNPDTPALRISHFPDPTPTLRPTRHPRHGANSSRPPAPENNHLTQRGFGLRGSVVGVLSVIFGDLLGVAGPGRATIRGCPAWQAALRPSECAGRPLY